MLMLDKAGLFLAFLFGAVILIFGGPNYLLLMITFFFFATVATKYGYAEKKEKGIYEHDRSWENVLSNGFVPSICALFSFMLGPLPFIGSVAAILSDKFASELGIFGGKPIFLGSLKPVEEGVSGGVTLLGFVMSLAGSVLIAISALFLFNLSPNVALYISFAGFIGSVVDSLFGVLEEMGLGNKHTTNTICAVTGGLLGYIIWVML